MRLVHEAEMAALALAIREKADAYVVDERTTRLLVEAPTKLLNILQHNLHVKIEQNKNIVREFQKLASGISIIRSVELVTIAYELGMLEPYLVNIPKAKEKLLESVIWGVKLEGCAVSKKELETILRIEERRR